MNGPQGPAGPNGGLQLQLLQALRGVLSGLRSNQPGPGVALPAAEGASDRRFQEAKRAFARRFHPDFVNATGMERTLRTDLFKEFWADLERIERGQDVGGT